MHRAIILVAGAVLLGGCGAGEGEGEAGSDADAAAPAAESAAPVTAAAPGVTDPQIAAIVVAANQVDVAAGELAREKGSSARVKEFAQRMITDHTAVNQQAAELVGRLGVTPEESATSRQLTQDGEAARQRLGALSGAEFDRAYVEHEVAYHQQVLDAIDRTLIPGARNAELKGLLEKTRPAVAAHLEHARQLQGSPESGS